MDDISTHASVAYTKLQTEYGSWTIFSQYITDDPIRFNMEIIINNSVDGYKIGVRSYNQDTFTVTTQWSPLIPELTKAQDEVFNLGFHIDRSNPGASTPFEFWLRVYVDFQLVYENEFTNGPPNILDPAYTNDIDSVGLRWCYTNPDYSGFSCLVHRWFYKAGAFTTGELASLSDAWEQNKSTYVDPDPTCVRSACKVYACDAYRRALLAASPVGYWPMNVPEDLAAFPASGIIKDYSTYANDLRLPSPLNDTWYGTLPSNLAGYDGCGTEMTDFKSTTSAVLNTLQGDTIAEFDAKDSWTWLSHIGGRGTNPSGGTSWLFSLRYKDKGSLAEHQITIMLDASGVGFSKVNVTFTNGVNVDDPGAIFADTLDNYDPDWQTKVIGVRFYPDADKANSSVDLLIDFAPVATATYTIAPMGTFLNGKDASELKQEAIEHSQLARQESVLFDRFISDSELLTLKAEFDRNNITYVDPDPLCGVTVPTPNEDPVPDRFALVWNFEDNNFTWMDASVIDAAELVPVVSMNYGLEPGWQTTWKSLQDHGIIWGTAGDTGLDNLMAGTDEWGDSENPTEWNDFYYAGKEQSMFWLSEVGVSESDQVLDKSGVKKYFAERVAMDFDDALGTTSNTYKHVRQLYPLLESPDSGAMNTYSFSIGWANNLMDDPDYKPGRTIYLNKTSYSGKHKIDTRSTGRYMAMKWDFTYTDEIAMTGVDIDIEESYGR
jgi:hypothetical protein